MIDAGLAMRILQRSRLDDETGCWVWNLASNGSGYGSITIGSRSDGTRRQMGAHVAAYESIRGPVPVGLEIDHLCNRPMCVNPSHLSAVTHAENLRRSDGLSGRWARRTHCNYGHPFDEANTMRAKDGARLCRTCVCARVRARYHARKAG